MGLIDKALKFGLDKMPPLTKSLKNVPGLATAGWVLKAARWGYAAGTKLDKLTGASDKISKYVFDKTGGASKGLIDKAERAEQLFNKGKGYYEKGKGYLDKGLKWGEQKLEKSIKKIVGADKTLPQNPSGSTVQLNKVKPAHSTPFPKTAQVANKTPSLNLPQIPNYHLLKPKLGRSLHLKSYKTGLNVGNNKAKINLRALANNKLFTIKPKAGSSLFNPANSKAFTIKTQASSLKFNQTKNKSFTIKPKTFSFSPKFNTPKLKSPTMNLRPASKSLLTNRPAFKSPAVYRPSRLSPINKPAFKSPFKR